jgi:carbon monoxide dehydrogenase subunit G
MALHFEGERDFSQPPQDLWEKLNDARFLAKCIPDVESVTRADRDILQCRLRPTFAFVRGTLDLGLYVNEAAPAQSVRLGLQTKGIGTTSRVETAMTFQPNGAGTRIHWAADVLELGGLLKAIPSGLIRAAAQKVIADAWDRVAAQVNGSS